MTQEEKDLLLRDLLPRLQYGVKIHTWYGEIITSDLNTFPIGYDEIDIEQLAGMKPYLRLLSNMTEEEEEEYNGLLYGICDFTQDTSRLTPITDLTTFFHSHHLDYRDLITMGLAIAAPKDMYTVKN